MRSWTHETTASLQRSTRYFPEYEPRFATLRGGFAPEVLERSYPSDGHGGHGFIPLLVGFDALLEEHPEVLRRDRELAVRINNDALRDPERRLSALRGQYEDQALTLHPSLGARLGPLYLAAMLDGALPRTYQLLSKHRPHGRVAHHGASCNPAKAHWEARSQRPYLRDPAAIERLDLDGGDAYAGTDGSFPSGHTSEAYWQGLTLATLLPELAPGILSRTADSGHSRVILGVHYPLDVIGGRMMGTAIAAARWHDPAFRDLLLAARAELREVLTSRAGAPLASVIAEDRPYLPLREAHDHYRRLLTYGFDRLGDVDDDLEVPPSAPDLLLTSHPGLSHDAREELLRSTALPAGYPLDLRGHHGGWQRLDLLAAMTAPGPAAMTVSPSAATPAPAAPRQVVRSR